MKKITLVLLVLIMAFSFAGCGGDPGYVTPDLYQQLCEEDWANMGQDEMEEFLGVEGVLDEDSTESWGEGYAVVNFPGEDDASYLHVLFSQNDDGSWRCSSMQPLGNLAE